MTADRRLHAALWGAQVLLAAMFAMAGLMKATQPIDVLAAKMGWPGALPEAMVRFIGLSELAGALGLILPSATRIQPKLTALAAVGLALVMALALPFHVSRGEFLPAVPLNLMLGAIAAFIAWGRFRGAPIAART